MLANAKLPKRSVKDLEEKRTKFVPKSALKPNREESREKPNA
jgi:hypothetical protein